jgi:hypothetical protein
MASSSSSSSSRKRAKIAAAPITPIAQAAEGDDGRDIEIARLRAEIASRDASDARLRARLFKRKTWSKSSLSSDAGLIVACLKKEYEVAYDDADAAALLTRDGFDPQDVRGTIRRASEWWDDSEVEFTPMLFYSRFGDLGMCRWLYSNGASEDVRRSNEDGTPMLHACHGGHLRICEWLFTVGAVADVSLPGSNGAPPMFLACAGGHLPVCRWLHEVGEPARKAENERNRMIYEVNQQLRRQQGGQPEGDFVERPPDITRAHNGGITPMYAACFNDQLSVCKWLFEVGVAADITKATNDGTTPMHVACWKGHLSVCKWLYEVGAAADITKADNKGATPMHWACKKEKKAVCEWLVCKGALAGDSGHIDPAIVGQSKCHEYREVVEWADMLVWRHEAFRSTILLGTFLPDAQSTTVLLRRALLAQGSPAHVTEMTISSLPEQQKADLLQKLRPRPFLCMLGGKGLAGAREHIAEFVGGVLRGSELRNVREFSEFADSKSENIAIFGAPPLSPKF